MKNSFLYIITVLIWGSTWYAIEFQLGEVAIEVSLIYRFGLAAILILALSKLKGLSLAFTMSQHFSSSTPSGVCCCWALVPQCRRPPAPCRSASSYS